MADHLAARARCTEFLKNHTRDVCHDELPALEECPICLDTYQNEQPVQIQVEGCSHILGRWCLEAMLTTNPRLEKTCPLCRTKWMDAPVESPAEPAVGLPPGRAIPMPFARSARPPNPPVSGAQDSVRSRRQPPRGTSLFSSNNNNPSGASFQPRIFNLIDCDDDEDPVLSFNSITRDINDVRERARNTRLSRKQRKEDKKQDGSSSLFGRSFLSKQEDTTANQQSQQSQQGQQGQQGQLAPSSSTVANVPSRFYIPHDLSLPDWFVPSSTQGVGPITGRTGQTANNAMIIDDTNSSRITAPNVPLPPIGGFSVGAQGSAQAQNSSQGPGQSSFYQPALSGSMRFIRPGGPPMPFLTSPSPDHDADATRNEAVRKQQEELTRREKEFIERERNLNNRERVLEERDREVFRREQRVAQREGADTRLVDLRARQLQELDEMVARHREESGV